MSSKVTENENLFSILSHLKNSRNLKTETLNHNENIKRFGNLLEWFICHFQRERNFQSHQNKDMFISIYKEIIKNKQSLMNGVDNDNSVRVVWCVRILLRDERFQQTLVRDADTLAYFSDLFGFVSCDYMQFKNDGALLDHLCRIFQKLSVSRKNHAKLLECNVHVIMIRLLASCDVTILHCSIVFLIALAECEPVVEAIVAGHVTESLLQMIQEYDEASKEHAANLLRILSTHGEIREQLLIYDALPILLSCINDSDQCELLWHITWLITRMCSGAETANEIRLLGGIPLLLNLLHKERSLTCGRNELTSAGHRNSKQAQSQNSRSKSQKDIIKNRLQLRSACCTAITELSLDERCTQTIVQNNGVYLIAQLIIPHQINEKCHRAAFQLQVNAIRALRFLFSLERNRKLFKLLFKPEMFQKFIDVGHFVRDSTVYKPLVDLLNSMNESSMDELRAEIEELNRNKIAKRHISEFDVYDVLGSGAFGSVYRVKRRSHEKQLALKELNISVGGGKSARERKKREIDEIVRELKIIREQLRHPNIVRYLSTFQENDKLYIEMELIEGATLQEHFTSLQEKKESGMHEDRIWKIFIQMCLALRYLHVDKKIVHRDLTANNVMLSENDKVTITDFGLAKHKRDKSQMTSAVGTILYWCPEIIKNEPYGEKADIWALGCLLYQMATLKPPFNGSNMLTLAKKIVEGNYEEINNDYSDLLSTAVQKCLTPDHANRPSICGLCGRISDRMMRYTDDLTMQHASAERKLMKERKRTQRHLNEARKNKHDYHSLFQASQGNQENFQRPSSLLHFNSNPLDYDVVSNDVIIASSNPRSSSADVLNSNNHNNNAQQAKTNSFEVPNVPQQNARPISSVSSSSSSRNRLLSISPLKVREIDDPVAKTLMQLHKIIYIDQLPPTDVVNLRRRQISRYKRALFAPNQTNQDYGMLKSEMHKLLQGSHDLIECCGVSNKETSLLRHNADNEAESDETTYAHMQKMIEQVLHESGYYQIPPSNLNCS